jgi:hypothetical protein
MRPLAILFAIDGTPISTGGAGAAAWRRAFEELDDIPADTVSESELPGARRRPGAAPPLADASVQLDL